MSWQECKYYWAWRGLGKPTLPEPPRKKLSYAQIFLDGKPHMRICSHVDGVRVNEQEIGSYTGVGWRVVMPDVNAAP